MKADRRGVCHGILERKRKGTPGEAGTGSARPADRHPFSLIDGYVPPAPAGVFPVPGHSGGGAGGGRGGAEAGPAGRRRGGDLPGQGGRAGAEPLSPHGAGGVESKGHPGFPGQLPGLPAHLWTGGGEIVPSRDGRDIAAVLCGRVSDVQVKEGDSPPWRFCWPCGGRTAGQRCCLARSCCSLPRTTPARSIRTGCPCSTACPFCRGVLLKIYQTLGANWERAGNVRFAVVYKPGEEALDHRRVQARSQLLAQRWAEAMESTRSGAVRDFVAVGGCGDQGHWRGVRHPRLPGTGADDSGAADRPDGDSSLPAGAELVLHRADEQPAGGHYDQ